MALKGKRILIADDDAEVLRLLATSFAKEGCNVLEADTGTEAFRLVQENPPDAVVTDMKMPGGDGKFLLARLIEFDPYLPVIIITGFSELNRKRAIELGATELFQKPFKVKELMQCIDAALLKRPA